VKLDASFCFSSHPTFGPRGVRLDVGQAVSLAHSLGASVHLEV
jgi:hypothetical protein